MKSKSLIYKILDIAEIVAILLIFVITLIAFIILLMGFVSIINN